MADHAFSATFRSPDAITSPSRMIDQVPLGDYIGHSLSSICERSISIASTCGFVAIYRTHRPPSVWSIFPSESLDCSACPHKSNARNTMKITAIHTHYVRIPYDMGAPRQEFAGLKFA